MMFLGAGTEIVRMLSRPPGVGVRSLLFCLVLLVLVAPAVAGPDIVSDEPHLWIGQRQMTFDEVADLLLSECLSILSVRHNAKSDSASSFYLEMDGGWQAKFRVVANPADTRRNEDLKREVACYEISRLLFPEGGIVKPSVFRRFSLESLLPLVGRRASARLRRWSEGGEVWGVLSPVGGRTVRAEQSGYFGGHVRPRPSRPVEQWPDHYLRQLGRMNLLAIITHNGDMHGDNWEIREADGACFIIDNGLTFTFDGRLPRHRRWRRPCRPAVALAASDVAAIRDLLRRREEVENRLVRLQGTGWGLSRRERAVVFTQAGLFLQWLGRGSGPIEITGEEYRRALSSGRMAPFRFGLGRPVKPVLITDW